MIKNLQSYTICRIKKKTLCDTRMEKFGWKKNDIAVFSSSNILDGSKRCGYYFRNLSRNRKGGVFARTDFEIVSKGDLTLSERYEMERNSHQYNIKFWFKEDYL